MILRTRTRKNYRVWFLPTSGTSSCGISQADFISVNWLLCYRLVNKHSFSNYDKKGINIKRTVLGLELKSNLVIYAFKSFSPFSLFYPYFYSVLGRVMAGTRCLVRSAWLCGWAVQWPGSRAGWRSICSFQVKVLSYF